jgi:hypothetical protein
VSLHPYQIVQWKANRSGRYHSDTEHYNQRSNPGSDIIYLWIDSSLCVTLQFIALMATAAFQQAASFITSGAQTGGNRQVAGGAGRQGKGSSGTQSQGQGKGRQNQ